MAADSVNLSFCHSCCSSVCGDDRVGKDKGEKCVCFWEGLMGKLAWTSSLCRAGSNRPTFFWTGPILILLCSLGAAQMRRTILKFSQFQDLMWFWGFHFRLQDDLFMEHTADLGIASSSSCWSCRLDLEEKLKKRWVKRTETAWNRLCSGNLFSRHWSTKASSGYSVINETWESMAYMHVIEDQCWMRSIYSNNRSKRNKR